MNLTPRLMEILMVASSASLLAGVVLLVVALVGRRVGIDIRCRRCRHEYPRGAVIPPVCSDCGADISRTDALILGQYRMRSRMLVVAIALLLPVPAGLVMLASGRRARIGPPPVAAAPDALIDAAMTGNTTSMMNLAQLLGGPVGPDTRAAWAAATKRFTEDAAARAAIVEGVMQIERWSMVAAGPSGYLVGDEALRAFGEALARALETDPALAEAMPEQRMDRRLPAALAEPVLASPAAVRAFLRGPTIAIRTLYGARNPEQGPAAARASERTIAPMLVAGSFPCFGRALAFGEAAVSYVRRDGSAVGIEVPSGGAMLVLDPDIGTRIPIGAALDDPEWSGELRLAATVGTVANTRVARNSGNRRPTVADPFAYQWTIRVERVTPSALRAIAVCDADVTSAVTRSLQGAGVQVGGEGDAREVTLEIEPAININGVHVALEYELLQDGRSWKESSVAQRAGVQRAPIAAVGFDPQAPFLLVVRGVPPVVTPDLSGDHAFAAGTWTVQFDRAARAPGSVVFAPLAGAPTEIPPEVASRGRDTGRVLRD